MGPIYNLAEFVAGLPGLNRISKNRTPTIYDALKKQKAKYWEALVAEYPWLSKTTESKSAKRARTSTGAASSSKGPDDDAGEDGDDEVSGEEEGHGVVLTDGEVDRILQELGEKRAV